jgi:phospholipid-binding lipoprotein MlaA
MESRPNDFTQGRYRNEKRLSIPVFTTAMLLAGTQLSAGESPPTVPVLSMALILAEQEDQSPPLPAAASPASAETPPPATRAPAQGEIIVEGKRQPTPGDPLEQINAKSYAITQDVDKAVVAPVARGYSKTIPAPIRSGLRNFFNNLAEPVVFLNYLLQIKPGKAAETFGRFAINSTAGGAGLFDIAKRRPFKLPLRRNGFANTMGYYGIKTGAFLFLPIIGPTTVRDLIGLTLDKAVVPLAVGKPFNQPYYSIPAGIIGSIDYRVEFDAELRKLHDSEDPYAASRDNYLRTRQAEIDELHGRHSATLPAPDAITPGTGPLMRPTLPPTTPSAMEAPSGSANTPVATQAPPAPDQPVPPSQD